MGLTDFISLSKRDFFNVVFGTKTLQGPPRFHSCQLVVFHIDYHCWIPCLKQPIVRSHLIHRFDFTIPNVQRLIRNASAEGCQEASRFPHDSCQDQQA